MEVKKRTDALNVAVVGERKSPLGIHSREYSDHPSFEAMAARSLEKFQSTAEAPSSSGDPDENRGPRRLE